MSFSQVILENPNVVPVDREMVKSYYDKTPAFKFEGEVFYSETFDFADASVERGWTLPEGWQIVDENDLGHYWTWRAGTDSIKGRYTFEPGHRFSQTPEDGYWVLPMDEYNYVDGVNLGNGGFAWFQMPSIDCSAHPSVIMKLNQYWRSCCGSPTLSVEVSNDQGVHWASYNMAFGTPTNSFCQRPRVEVNISEVAAGMNDVWIRFVWNNNSHYFWCIDDFRLEEGYTNEIQIEDSWIMMSDFDDQDQDEGFTFMTPLSQIDNTLGGWTFRTAVINTGRDDQYGVHLNAAITRNGSEVFNESSTSGDIWALDRDTFDVDVPYFPDDYGTYKFILTADQEQEDAVPENNLYEDYFYVTDSIYSMADWDFETYSSTASWGNNDGDYLGVVYDITKDCEVNSISVMIQQRAENPQASTQVGYGFQFWIFWYDDAESLWVPIISSDYYEVEQDMINTWTTFPLEKDGESEFLTPGKYIASIQGFHGGGNGPDNNVYRFTIGSDKSHKYNSNKSVYSLITGDAGSNWNQNSTDLSMIRMNLNNTGAPAMAAVTFNVDMTLPLANGYFHTWDHVDVAGNFNDWSGSGNMEDPDGDGIYTQTITAIPVFTQLEYKYRINSNWDTSEFPLGGPNRVYRTSYYNDLDDEYNNGVSMGIDISDLNSSMKVYPNPSNGLFSLEVVNANAADLNITVSNIQGKVIYQKQINNVLSHQESIDLTGVSQGVYFLNVNGQVSKLIVK